MFQNTLDWQTRYMCSTELTPLKSPISLRHTVRTQEAQCAAVEIHGEPGAQVERRVQGLLSHHRYKTSDKCKEEGGLYPDSVKKGRQSTSRWGRSGRVHGSRGVVKVSHILAEREKEEGWGHSAFPLHASGDPSRRLLPPTFKMALPASV